MCISLVEENQLRQVKLPISDESISCYNTLKSQLCALLHVADGLEDEAQLERIKPSM